MAIGGVLGNGSKAGFSAASPVVYTKLAQLMDIPNFLSLSAKDIDTTVYSTSTIMTYMPGMTDPPDIKLDCLLDLDPVTTASQESLRVFQTSRTTLWWRIEVPVDRTQTNFRAWEFQAYVKEWTPTVKLADKQTLALTLKYAGSLAVYLPGASILG